MKHNCILIFDAKQVHLKPQVTKFMNKSVTANSKVGPNLNWTPKPQTQWIFENPKL